MQEKEYIKQIIDELECNLQPKIIYENKEISKDSLLFKNVQFLNPDVEIEKAFVTLIQRSPYDYDAKIKVVNKIQYVKIDFKNVNFEFDVDNIEEA